MSRSWYDLNPLGQYIEQGFVLLTPNFRLARRIKAEWDAQRIAAGDKVWEPLSVYPLESWLQQRWQEALAQGLVPALVPLTPGQVLERWQQAIALEEEQSGSYNLLRPTAAAELCNQARDTLVRWQVALDSPGVSQAFELDDDCTAFLRWNRLFEQQLALAGQCTAADCIRQLLDCAGQLPPAQAVLLEFDDVPPLHLAVAEALCGQLVQLQPGGGVAQQVAQGFADKRTELEAVARWAAASQAQNKQQRVGIVLSDMSGDRAALEYLLRREFDCLGDKYDSLPVNFSTGISLDRAPVVRDALAVLALGGQSTTVTAVVALLQSRFLGLADAGSALANRFISRLHDDGQHELSIGDLRHQASQVSLGKVDQQQASPPAESEKGLVLGQYLMAMASMRELRRGAQPSAWAQRFSTILDLWQWPGTRLDSLEYQQVELWYRTLDEFAAYDSVCSELDYGAALRLLRSCCERQMSQPSTGDSSVQVLGPLEAAGLSFDQLWLCGMQAGSWPAAARPNPFIPHSLQRQHDMPHSSAEREWMFAATLLKQYRHSCTVLNASYCVSLDGVGELPSTLLTEFEWPQLEATAVLNDQWLARWRQRSLESTPDQFAPALDANELASIGGGSGLLEDQSQCPFRAFSRRRLRVEPLGSFSVALSPAERGSLLHDALYALWGEIGDHASLLALQGEARVATVQRAVSAALEAVAAQRRRAIGNAYWDLEGRHLHRLLEEWLLVEERRTAFVVSQREEAVSLELGQLQIRLRVDRIDQLPDGSKVIIDYKTGVSKVTDWLGERPAKPQLLLYGIAEPEGAAALAFAQLRPRASGYIGLGETAFAPGVRTDIGKIATEDMGVEDWPALNAYWRHNLEQLAMQFVAGDAGVDPASNSSCTWCGLQALCRIGLEQEATA